MKHRIIACMVFLVLLSCTKENEAPLCAFQTPQMNEQFLLSQEISINILAYDSDGSIEEVTLFVDDAYFASDYEWPYNFSLESSELESGQVDLKAIAYDFERATAEDAVTFQLGSLPIVSSNLPTLITANSANISGLVEAEDAIISSGFYVSTFPDSEATGEKYEAEPMEGAVKFQLNDLQSGTMYYYTTYASNSFGTSLSEEKKFRTEDLYIPVVTTHGARDVTATSAEFWGSTDSDGGSPITIKGFCWSTSPDPKIDDSVVYFQKLNNHTVYISVYNLQPSTTYYYRAFAFNEIGIGYGKPVSFTTL